MGSIRLTGKPRKRTLSMITNKRITKRGVKAKGAASRLIARAVEGSEAERRLIRMVRRLALKQGLPRINKVVLPVPGGPKRPHLAIPFGQRGMPMVTTSDSRREPAMCNIPAATYVNPNAAMGGALGTQEMDPTISPQQTAMQIRDQMMKQVKAMVKASLLKKQRAMAPAAAMADPSGLTEVSVQDDLDRMNVDLQGVMQGVMQDSRQTLLFNGTSWSQACASGIIRSLLPPT